MTENIYRNLRANIPYESALLHKESHGGYQPIRKYSIQKEV